MSLSNDFVPHTKNWTPSVMPLSSDSKTVRLIRLYFTQSAYFICPLSLLRLSSSESLRKCETLKFQ